MRDHLELLVLLQRVWGVFGVLTGASLGVLATGTDAALVQIGSAGRAERAAVWVLAASGLLLLTLGAGALAAASGIRRRRPAARIAALALAVPNFVIVPFGTLLGIYTVWALINDDARREFGRPPRAHQVQ